jgi:hypothetical protein
MLTFSYVSKTLYHKSITTLRTHLEKNRAGYVDITIMPYESAPSKLDVRMDRKTLYIDGFRKSPDGQWYHFKDATGWTGSKALPYGGRHGDLKTNQDTTKFTAGAKFKADQIINFSGDKADTLRLGLSYLVVTISEATRFPAVEKNVSGNVGGVETYLPKKDHKKYMSNWATLTKAGGSEVAIPYIK